jgi:hypothetical protein
MKPAPAADADPVRKWGVYLLPSTHT